MRNFFRKLFSGDVSPTIVSNYNNLGFEHLSDTRNLNTYKESLYLFIAVSKIAKRASGVPLELHRIKNLQGETEEIFDHQLIDVFSAPNDMQTQREFMEMSFAHYLLAGDCFWYFIREGNQIVGMLPLMPDKMEIILNQKNTEIIGYEYRNGDYVKIAPEDIVHIKNPDPTNILRGVGAVRPATTRILTERDAAKYQANFFENYGRPDIAVLMDRAITEDTAAQGRKMWQQTFGKGGSDAKVGFFGNDTKSIQELNKTPKEMDFIGSMHFLRDDILAALGVPKAMVTTDDVNLANSKEAYRMFLQEAVVPVLDAFVDTINHRLIPRVDETMFFRYDDPTPADRDMELKEVTALKKNGIITANEARERYEYEQHEDGDQLSQSQNNARIEVQEEAKQILRHRRTLVRHLKASESLKNALTEPKRSMSSIFPTKEMKVSYAKAVNDRIDRKAETLKDAIDEFHQGQMERILENDLRPDAFMDVTEEKRRAKDALTPILQRLYKEGGQAALDDVFRKSADTFFADEVLLSAIASRAEFFTNSMTETTFEVLKHRIADGLREGKGPEDVGRDIRDYFTDMSAKRARTIARTETNYALSKATNDAYQQSSVVTGKEWISAGDSKVRPEHQENNGEIIAKGGAFPNGEEYPGHMSVNCRCVLSPAV